MPGAAQSQAMQMVQVPLDLLAHLLAHYSPVAAPPCGGPPCGGAPDGRRSASVLTLDALGGGPPCGAALSETSNIQHSTLNGEAEAAKAKLQVGNGDHLSLVLTEFQKQLAAMRGEMQNGFAAVGTKLETVVTASPAIGTNSEPGKQKAEIKTGPRYSLRKGLGCWELVLDGRRATVDDVRGVHIVAYLLRNPPPERLHAVNLEKLVWAQGFVGETSSPLAGSFILGME